MVGLNIQDPARYEEYAAPALASLLKYNVEILVVSDAPVAVGGVNPYRRYVLLKYPDQASIPIRQASSETGFFVTVNGLS